MLEEKPDNYFQATLVEYSTLRTEILQNQRLVTDLLNYAIVATGVIFGIGATSKLGYVFLVSFAVLIPLSHAIRMKSDSIMELATYILLAIESKNRGFGWETFQYDLRNPNKTKQKLRNLFECVLIFNLLSISAMALAFSFSGFPDVIGITVGVLVFVYFLWWNFEAFKTYTGDKQAKLMKNFLNIL
jgi:hypothetical protein